MKPTLKSPRVSVVFEPYRRPDLLRVLGPVADAAGDLGRRRGRLGAGDHHQGPGKPEDSEIWEAGAKVRDPQHHGLAVTASLFDVRKDNALQTDPATGFLQVQSGEKQEVKGVEFGVTGKINDHWTVSAGYTYLDAKIKESFTNCTVAAAGTTGTPTGIVCAVGVTVAIPTVNQIAVGNQVTFVPKNAASFFTSYDLSSWIPGLSIGGDATYQSKLNVGYTARSVSYTDRASQTAVRLSETPESINVNAFASYKTGPYRFAINGYNLTDRLNYTQVFGNRAVPAAGRTIIVSVGTTF